MKSAFKARRVKQDKVARCVFTPLNPISWQLDHCSHAALPHEATDIRGDERWLTISRPNNVIS